MEDKSLSHINFTV